MIGMLACLDGRLGFLCELTDHLQLEPLHRLAKVLFGVAKHLAAMQIGSADEHG